MPVEALTVDQVLLRHVGELGFGQFRHFVLVTLSWTLVGLQTFTMMFSERDPGWHCLETSPLESSTLFMPQLYPISPINVTYNSSSYSNFSDESTFISLLRSAQRLSVPQNLLKQEKTVFQSPRETVPCSTTVLLCELKRNQWEWNGGRKVSVVTEWDLVCGESYKAGLVGSVFFTGFLFGAGIGGTLSDGSFGRKGALGSSLVVALIFGILTSFAPNYWTYLIFRGITGIGLSGASVTQYILATELVGPNKRGQIGLATAYTYALGQMILAVIAYYVRTWRHLFLATTLPIFFYCCVVFPFVEESPRWYLVHGKPGKALEVLRNLARRNGRSFPDSLILKTECEDRDLERDGCLKQNGDEIEHGNGKQDVGDSSSLGNSHEGTKNSENDVVIRYLGDPIVDSTFSHGAPRTNDASTYPIPKGTFLEVFQYKITRDRMFIMLFCWFTCAIVYYGLSLNSVNLGENVYLSTFLNAFIEFPAYIILAFVIEKIGRRPLIMGGLFLSGFCCLCGVFFLDSSNVPSLNSSLSRSPDMPLSLNGTNEVLFGGSELDAKGIFVIIFALLGKFGISSSYALAYLYAGELFPTVVRNTALSIASQSSQLGSILAPWVLVLKNIHVALPMVSMGVLGIAAAGLILPLPETLNEPLLETMEGLLSH